MGKTELLSKMAPACSLFLDWHHYAMHQHLCLLSCLSCIKSAHQAVAHRGVLVVFPISGMLQKFTVNMVGQPNMPSSALIIRPGADPEYVRFTPNTLNICIQRHLWQPCCREVSSQMSSCELGSVLLLQETLLCLECSRVFGRKPSINPTLVQKR